jgi:predicted acylesterase/phospholipase RssA
MSEPGAMLTRRMMIAGALGGATVAGALAAQTLREPLRESAGSFVDAFTSPFRSLINGDHTAWSAEIGALVELAGGAVLRISRVELFAPFGEDAEDLNRSRAFAVTFENVNRATVESDTIYRVTHPDHGSFELFLITAPSAPTTVQAIFN